MARDDVVGVHLGLVARLLDGEGKASLELRRAAFDSARLNDGVRDLVETVALDPAGVADEDFATARASGLSEDQVWEVVICAAVGQASRQYEVGLAALDAALSDQEGL